MSAPQKQLLVISFSEIRKDARVLRQIKALREHYNISAAGFGPCPLDGIEWFEIPNRHLGKIRKTLVYLVPMLGFYRLHSWLAFRRARALLKPQSERFQAIVANDIESLPLAFSLGGGSTPIVCDAHEYSPRQYEHRLGWRLRERRYIVSVCRRYLHRCSKMFTVCDPIADEYAREFAIPRPTVVCNAPAFVDLPVSKTEWPIRMVHHGGANPGRRIELMIEAFKRLDSKRYTLDLVLMKMEPGYFSLLEDLVRSSPNIRIVPPVTQSELTSRLNANYDVGIYLLPPTNFNNANALPNKIFDFVQARLAAIVGPTPPMAHIVSKYELGVVSRDFSVDSFAEALATATPSQVDAWKAAAARAARELHYDNEREKLISGISAVFSDRH